MSATKLSHKERVERLLEGKEIDRAPVSAWRHFYNREDSADNLAAAMLDFQKKFNWDFMKINPRASYYVEDWGCRFSRPATEFEKPQVLNTAVSDSSDWLKIKKLDIQNGAYGEQLKAVDMIIKALDHSLDCVQTVFSPLSIAADLTGSDTIFAELLSNRTNLESALQAISDTVTDYVDRLLKIGVSGIFFATTEWGTRDRITEEEYLEFGRPFDMKVMEAARRAKFNIVHVCKQNNLLPLFKHYPCQLLSWNKHEPGNLDFGQAKSIFSQAFLGGVDQIDTLQYGNAADIIRQCKDAMIEADGHPLIIAPGCALKVTTPLDNIRALRDSVEK